MKVLLTFAAFVGIASCQVNRGGILVEFLDFMQVIPTATVMEVVQDHLDNDPEFGAGVKYLQSKEWLDLNDRLFATPEFQDLKKHLTTIGIPIDFLLRFTRNMMMRAKPSVVGDTINFEPFIEDIGNAIPFDKILAVANDKLHNSDVFKSFYEAISSKETYKLVEKVRQLPEAKLIMSQLMKMGVRVDEYIRFIYTFFNWGTP